MKAHVFERLAISLTSAFWILLLILPTLASEIDESFSLSFANSLDLPALSGKVVKIDVFLSPDGNPHIPPDPSKTSPSLVLSGSQRSQFFELLGKTGRTEWPEQNHVTSDVIGCYIYTKTGSPGYLFLRNLRDGRWYLHFYSTRDSVGGFNQALGEFLWGAIKDSGVVMSKGVGR